MYSRLVIEQPDEAVGAGDGERTPLTPTRSVPVYSGQKATQPNEQDLPSVRYVLTTI